MSFYALLEERYKVLRKRAKETLDRSLRKGNVDTMDAAGFSGREDRPAVRQVDPPVARL